ncbi:MAG: response regulator [Proteobacteria bacterium]|nr:response regulator [Pseudomonadota bacterium]
MPVITIVSGIFCNKESIVNRIAEKAKYQVVNDDMIVAKAHQLSGLSEKSLQRAFTSKTSLFNNFTHEKERAVAWLKLSMAQFLEKDKLIIDGASGLFIPKSVSHVLRVLLIGDVPFRIQSASRDNGLSEKEAHVMIKNHDENLSAFVDTLFKSNDPWANSLYDMVVPVDKMDEEKIITLITDHLTSDVIKPSGESKKAAADFSLSAQVEVSLAKEGHAADVFSREGNVTLTINKNVLLLNRLEEELKTIAGKVAGVKSVDTQVGKGFYQTDIYRKHNFEMPSKILLVDDEREFVQTLSERLLMREMGSLVAYDGESALSLISKDDPEVMILDLNMPGIDGIEVLRRVKQTRPEIAVIILTGHGSEKDKDTCLKLGAFSYLQKPVDIDVLSDTLKKANAFIKQNQMKTK